MEREAWREKPRRSLRVSLSILFQFFFFFSSRSCSWPTMAESGCLVCDPGSWSFKYGLAGDDRPRVNIPSTVGLGGAGLRVGRTALAELDEEVQLKDAIAKGKVVSWEAFEALLDFGDKVLFDEGKEPESRRYLFAEGYETDEKYRKQLAELIFEKKGGASLFFSKTGPLNLYACARSTGIVLDIGGDSSVASVIVDGFLSKDSVQSTPVGGKLLSSELLKRLEKDENITVAPRFSFSEKHKRDGSPIITRVDTKCHPSFSRFWKLDIMEEFFHRSCRISSMSLGLLAKEKTNKKAVPGESAAPLGENGETEKQPSEKNDGDPAAENVYTLPDGTEVPSAASLTKQVGELLFDPKPLERDDIPFGVGDILIRAAQTVHNADTRRDLLGNIVLAGGSTAILGLPARVAGEIAAKARSAKPRVIVGGAHERKYNAWIGGSILGSLTNLQDLWVTQKEFKEHGDRIFLRKCP